MGQRVVGLLYGCEAPELGGQIDNESDYHLLARWEKVAKPKPHKPRLRIEREGGKTLWGIWIALSNGSEDGAEGFDEAMPLTMVQWEFPARIKKAEKLWDRFARHVAKKEKIVLPAAVLWLTPCEVA